MYIKEREYLVSIEACDGRLISSDRKEYLQFRLPLSFEGAEIVFILEDSFWIDILPDQKDKITGLSTHVGQRIYSIERGSEIRLRGVPGGWNIVSSKGQWLVAGNS